MFGAALQPQALVYTPSRGASYYLIRLTALILFAGIPILLTSIAKGDYRPVELYFDYLSTPFMIACALAEVVLAGRAVHIFDPGEPLRAAWQVIRAAAVFQVMGLVLRHLLGTALIRNPLVQGNPHWSQLVIQQFRDAGYVLSGPLRMALLAVGLGFALRTMNRLIRPRITLTDYALLVPAIAFAGYQTFLFSKRLMDAPTPENFASMMDVTNNPLLALLLFQALMIFRSLREMGGGLIARCWGAFAAGILLTCLGTFGQWATDYGYLPWPYSSIVWYVWLPAAAAYAIAPAYQLEAAWALHVVELKTDPIEKPEQTTQTEPKNPAAGRLSATNRVAVSSTDSVIVGAAAALWEQALSQEPTLLGKLVMAAGCRIEGSNAYEHAVLGNVPHETASGVIRSSHRTLFTRWLTLGFEEKLKDWLEYLEPFRDRGAPKRLLKGDWQRLLPPLATRAEKVLFETDVAVVLELSKE